MNLFAAVRAAAPRAPAAAADALASLAPNNPALATSRRAAHLIGQCAHESGGFRHLVEVLSYTAPDRLMAVWPSRFRSRRSALPFVRNPVDLANEVYANRMGNGDATTGDGHRFRGRGFIQLTGRANYAAFGPLVGVDLLAEPERAAEPRIAWLIATQFFARRSRRGRTALEWADWNSVEMVTRIINGGTNGIADRRSLTARALAALEGSDFRTALARDAVGPAVVHLQSLLASRGFSPGAIDGDFGGNTERALMRFQASAGLPRTGVADAAVWDALEAPA